MAMVPDLLGTLLDGSALSSKKANLGPTEELLVARRCGDTYNGFSFVDMPLKTKFSDTCPDLRLSIWFLSTLVPGKGARAPISGTASPRVKLLCTCKTQTGSDPPMHT